MRCSYSLTNERIDLLLERQLHADAHGAVRCLLDRVRAFIRSLHEARTTAANDVASHFRQFSGQLFHSLISDRAGFEPGRAEDSHAIILASRAAETRQVIDHFPQAGHCALEQCDRGIFVAEANDVGLPEG